MLLIILIGSCMKYPICLRHKNTQANYLLVATKNGVHHQPGFRVDQRLAGQVAFFVRRDGVDLNVVVVAGRRISIENSSVCFI